MNMQQVVQPGSPSNGYGHRKTEKDLISRFDSKLQFGKTDSSKARHGKGVGHETSSRDRLVYLTTCLIGHQVEVQVLDGSVFSGIFHASNIDDFGIVLKKAHLIKDGSNEQKNIPNSLSKPPFRTLIIPPKDFVQVIAKGVPVSKEDSIKELQYDIKRELMTDACISRSRHVDIGRELQPWVPDENDCSRPELENIFDDNWNRGWDQFQANESLFGVKSTFKEELYTTKLEKGPQMRELEREAIRIAREIEGEETLDLHLAEERGIQLDANLEIDEETRFSSVYKGADDSGYDETDDTLLDSQNDETFGCFSDSTIGKSPINANTGKTSDGTQVSLCSSTLGEAQSNLIASSSGLCNWGSKDHMLPFTAEQLPNHSPMIDASRHHENRFTASIEEDKVNQKVVDKNQVSKDGDSHKLLRQKIDSSDKVGLSSNATAYDPPHVPSKCQEKALTSNVLLEGNITLNAHGAETSLARPSSSASSISDRGAVTSTSAGRGLSPSSSGGSLYSDKSMLNPHAKEFKLNPNAKSFVPSLTTLRPPVSDSSFYYPANMTAVPHMHGMPANIGIGPPFIPQQPVIFNPQAAPMPQPYYHPSGPQYGQQMIIGQPRPALYMPTYPPDVSYNGREF